MTKYHLRRQDRQIKDKSKLNEIIANGKFAVISMCLGDEPYIVTLSYGYEQNNNAMYFHCANAGQKLDFIMQNPKVCATVIEDRGYTANECVHEYATAVIRGKMSVIQDLIEKKHGMEILLNHLEADSESVKEKLITNNDVYKNITVLKLNIEEITCKKGR